MALGESEGLFSRLRRRKETKRERRETHETRPENLKNFREGEAAGRRPDLARSGPMKRLDFLWRPKQMHATRGLSRAARQRGAVQVRVVGRIVVVSLV